MKTIFVSIPYSHSDREIREQRYRTVAYYTTHLMYQGFNVLSPVIVGHPMIEYIGCQLPGDYTFWESFSIDYINRADEMHVLTISGWSESTGVQGEIEHAQSLNMDIKYISMPGEE